MKNKMIKRSHLSEQKCREIIQFFSEDLTATHIAHITGVSRVTINNYLKLIRTHIAGYCEEQSPPSLRPAKPYFVQVKKLNGMAETSREYELKNAHYGFYRFDGNIFADWLYNIDKPRIQEMQRARLLQQEGVAVSSSELSKYHAIADFEDWRLYRMDTQGGLSSRNFDDDIAVFWGHTRNRLLKFRGLNKNTLYLHVKESEFRYNNRNLDINSILLSIINQKPLHLSKVYD
jgi:transposase